jgi:hypothetical protein
MQGTKPICSLIIPNTFFGNIQYKRFNRRGLEEMMSLPVMEDMVEKPIMAPRHLNKEMLIASNLTNHFIQISPFIEQSLNSE